jgi:hypothetical protein
MAAAETNVTRVLVFEKRLSTLIVFGVGYQGIPNIAAARNGPGSVLARLDPAIHAFRRRE